MQRRQKRIFTRGEARDELRSEIQTPELNQRGTASTGSKLQINAFYKLHLRQEQ